MNGHKGGRRKEGGKEPADLREPLRKELDPLVFTQAMKDSVLEKARQPSFWDKEFRVPLIPAACLFGFLLFLGIGWLLDKPEEPGATVAEQPQIVILDSGIFNRAQMEREGDRTP